MTTHERLAASSKAGVSIWLDDLSREFTDEALALRGQAALANSRLAYAAFQEVHAGPRWAALAARGARARRPLWAQHVFDELQRVGIDLTDMFLTLENEGVEKFETSWDGLGATVLTQLDQARR